MNQQLQEKCQLFVDNKNLLDKTFKWDSGIIMPVCAAIYTERNQKVQVDKMKECRKILKEKIGIFSVLRGYGEMVLLTKMALSENPKQYLEDTMEACLMIKKFKMTESSFTAIAAMLLVDNVERAEWEAILKKTQFIYLQMKKAHPFLTGTEDVSFAILMAMSDVPEEWLVQEMEACYKIVSKKFGASERAQALSQILAVDEKDTEIKCEEIFQLNQMFKAKNKRLEDMSVILLAGMNLLNVNKDKLLEEMIEVDSFLKTQKGFGFWGMSSRDRFMHAAILVMNQYDTTNQQMDLTMMSSAINMIIAQYTAMFVAIMAVTAASNATSS